MNKMNKKGFTIVELVIVIAVIAILAGVLIPTFGGIIERANESAEMQKVAAAYKEAYAEALGNDGKVTASDFTDAENKVVGITVGDFKFTLNADGKTWEVDNTKNDDYSYAFNSTDNTWTVTAAQKAS